MDVMNKWKETQYTHDFAVLLDKLVSSQKEQKNYKSVVYESCGESFQYFIDLIPVTVYKNLIVFLIH